jgi:hypothetical protein
MIAHEAVIISPPYRPEDCKGSAQKVQVLNQVKKVLEGERRKLSEKEKAGGARKGGWRKNLILWSFAARRDGSLMQRNLPPVPWDS